MSARTFRRVALASAVAAVALPAAAQASTVELKSDGTLTVRAAAGEANNVHISPQGVPGVRLRDFGANLTVRGSGCVAFPNAVPPEVRCAGTTRPIARIDVALGDRDDLYVAQNGFATAVDGAAGNDMYFHDGKAGLTTTRVDFRGGDGNDTASYSPATAGVIVTKDGVANDGRTINGSFVIDRDNVRPDVERLLGSSHNDSLNGSNVADFGGKLVESFSGGAGDDIMTGGPAEDFFDMGIAGDGADEVRGGGGSTVIDAVSYGSRTGRVTVTVGHGSRDDGEAGERDDVTGIERVLGGRGSDTISQMPGSTLALSVSGNTGDDTILGANGNDGLFGDGGLDTISGGAGGDTIFAGDGERDTVDCGTNPAGLLDSAVTDGIDSVRNCESSSVGKLQLGAKTVRANVSGAAELKLSWTHPKAWRKLRSITVRVLDAGRQVGEVTIDPRRERLAATGDLKLASRSALGRKGKTVSARLALKVDRALAGRELAFEVEATDVDGRRQVER